MLILPIFILIFASVYSQANQNQVTVQKYVSRTNTSEDGSDGTESTTTQITTTVGEEPFSTTLDSCGTNDTECSVNVTTVAPPTNGTNSSQTTMGKNKKHLSSKIETDINICTCNLQVDFCDINCCCDPDCSERDKTVFGYCEIDENRFYDTRYCNYIKYIYINNTPFKWEVNQDGLFCIISSNLPDTYLIQKEDPIDSFDTVNPHQDFWGEEDNIVVNKSQLGLKNYEFGDSLMMVDNDSSIGHFRLPKSFLTSSCIFEEDVYFLNDVEWTCGQTAVEDGNLKLTFASYFKNFKIIGSPKLLNVTKLKNKIYKNCPKTICPEIEPKLCDWHFSNCSDVKENASRFHCYYNLKENVNNCRNGVKKIRYKFYHNGTDGINKVEILGVLEDFSYHFGHKNFELVQEFSVEFLWTNQIKNYSRILSGNPGYISGKPILIGVKNVYGNATVIQRNSLDFLDNFLVFPSSTTEVCVRNETFYTPIEFQYNTITKCDFQMKLAVGSSQNATELCRNIQGRVFDLWGLERAPDKSSVVGLFGNANASNLQDWTSVLYETEPREFLNTTRGSFLSNNKSILCQNLSTLLDVHVFYSRVDFKTVLNQNKILGVSISFKNIREGVFAIRKQSNSSSLELSLKVVSRVSFYDITERKVEKFVDPPSLDIRLPYDFFYPFIRVGNGVDSGTPKMIVVVVFLYLMYLF